MYLLNISLYSWSLFSGILRLLVLNYLIFCGCEYRDLEYIKPSSVHVSGLPCIGSRQISGSTTNLCDSSLEGAEPSKGERSRLTASGQAPKARDQSIFTAPNAITVARLMLLPLVVVELLAFRNFIVATLILAFIGVTDFLDGYVARRFNQVSELGKIIDPSADRVVIVVIGIVSVSQGWIPLPLGILILIREGIITIISIYLFQVKGYRLDVVWLGKVGTFLLLVALPLILLGESSTPNLGLLHAIGIGLSLLGTLTLYGAAIKYLRLLFDSKLGGK